VKKKGTDPTGRNLTTLKVTGSQRKKAKTPIHPWKRVYQELEKKGIQDRLKGGESKRNMPKTTCHLGGTKTITGQKKKPVKQESVFLKKILSWGGREKNFRRGRRGQHRGSWKESSKHQGMKGWFKNHQKKESPDEMSEETGPRRFEKTARKGERRNSRPTQPEKGKENSLKEGNAIT